MWKVNKIIGGGKNEKIKKLGFFSLYADKRRRERDGSKNDTIFKEKNSRHYTI